MVALIKRLSAENPFWRAPRIQSELALFGYRIGETTVGKYMVRGRCGDRHTWQTFLQNHMSVAAACDFFTVPTLTSKMLYVFVVLSHNRRRILHVNVTRHSTGAWTTHQLVEAFADGEEPRFLHRDGDSIFGPAFRKRARALGIDEVVSARESPWQNPYVERATGSIRRSRSAGHVAAGHEVSVGHEWRPGEGVLGLCEAQPRSTRCRST